MKIVLNNNLVHIKIGDIIVNNDGSLFKVWNDGTSKGKRCEFPIESECIYPANDHTFCIGEKCTWNIEGKFNDGEVTDNYNISKIITKEENPEYFL